ncbi:translocation/assembly module TamB domain-containing protein [Dysgonomonas sp. 511]|uniref:translocation/assembly module TamB domain-containing protein n=1 Tax=Dysgonomonas sp. 511 TaxID=2302930 RepID=UPI0013D84BD5|nr:translocation/assembly module TamB domain-containing protein [Dysgonomonas sp. 511]NDV78356.1 hypothetical protein [Dysgonomonas sp. 511]
MEQAEDVKATPQQPAKKSLPRRILKTLLYVFIGFIGLNALLYTLFSIPYVQQKAAGFAVEELKKTLNTEVSIEEVRLSLFNKVSLKGVYIEDQAADTLLYANNLSATLSPWKFIKNSTLAITSVTAEDFVINVNRKDSISDFNFQFIVDAFSGTDTIPADTTKSSLVIVIEDISLKRGRLRYDVLSDTVTPGIFNASHIAINDLNANLDLNSIDPDKFDIALNELSAKETSGVEIKSLKGHFFSDKSQLWIDGLALYLPGSHLITQRARYNLSTDEFEVNTEDTEIEPIDLAAFLPNLKFLKNKISLNTALNGTLPSVNIEHINLTYGNDLYLEGNAGLASYERYGESDINLFIDRFKASPAAVTSLARLGDSTFVAPDILNQMGDIFLKGQVTGQLKKFRLDAEAWCRQGAITMVASGRVDTTFSNFDVLAGLNTKNFNLGNLLGGTTGLGTLSANVDITALQHEASGLTAEAKGNLIALGYEQNVYNNIPFEGYYNPHDMGISANADLPVGKVVAEASMTQDNTPDINVYLNADNLHIDHFYKNDYWVNPRLSLVLDGKIKGIDIDNIAGIVTIDSLDFHDANYHFQPGKFTLESGKKESNEKYISLTSSLLTANISGQYAFATLPDEISDLMHSYLPAVFPETKKLKTKNNYYKNNFAFNISANNTEELGKILELPVDVILPARINGNINTIGREIKLRGDIPYLRYGAYDIKNTHIGIENTDSIFNGVANSNILMDEGIYKLGLLFNGKEDLAHSLISLSSENTDINIAGGVESTASFSRNASNELVSKLDIKSSNIYVGNLAINILPAEISNVGDRTEIQNFGLGVNNRKYFGVEGVISKQKTDSLKAYFNHAEIGDLLEAFDIKNIRGCIHGDVMLTNLLDMPELYTEGFQVADIIIFGDTLGTMNLESQWSDYFGGARVNALLKKGDEEKAELDGTVYTSPDSLDLQLRLDEMQVGWIQPFVADMANKVSGSISTNLIIEGSTKAPLLRGFVGFNDTQIGIDYTNVVYTISDTIQITPGNVGLNNLTLKDSHGNSASVNASLTHKNFGDMKYKLDMQMTNLMVLNTMHRTDSLFYGRVFASGTVKIEGDDDGVNMNMQIRNDKNSVLNILLPQSSEATDYRSVVYINVPEDKLEKEKDNTTPSTSFSMNMKIRLDVTKDLTLGVVIDPLTGDAMQANGNGTINFGYDMDTENMSTFGDYTLTGGNVSLNLQGVKRIGFQIQNGSKLNFIGDPMRTRFDITAYHRVRATLTTLDNSFAFDELSSPRVNVDCVLGIKGNMNKMDLTYDINVPEAEEDVQSKIRSLIATSEQKIKQFAYLIATGSFYPETGGNTNLGQGLWTSVASSTLSKGLSSIVGNILGDSWEVGTNIESNDGTLESMDMSVNVSRGFMDGKLKVKTNLGYRTDQTNQDNIISDFDVEYQLNSLWTLRGYNHTNDRYYRTAPYTQGIGIVYTKEAATLKRLFSSFKPRRRNRNNTTQNQDSAPQDKFPAQVPPAQQPAGANNKETTEGGR